ncbi:hypothetical protein [Tabrizicola sp.]|uniref:hypothetical protein n=1 Tax=Tabrizicola sp. TaxID=2005166 RepID=UPI00273494A2|nr:hypothetical protein [Tabrizicola sp.]MDP3197650.1 hypothetical protein [Tabrizicola sp.]
MNRTVVLLLATLGAPAAAETLAELRNGLTGREITVSGHIGTGLDIGDDEALSFRDLDGNTYPVVFDAGRTARKTLEGCKFAMFGGGSPCAMDGKAELELDGSRLRLIIYEVASIAPPAPLK